ncbi:MAG TPA: OpcA/G6PD domain-containing protein [Candidatus Baltobacteraceae bacterium]|nr:OpcA/G6PD domain-containing protein [Candidatus Baltobacteraceae bacterium]
MAAIAVDHLLDELARAQAGEAEVAATALNVVAFVESDRDLLARLLQRVDALAGRRATRSIVLSAFEDASDQEVSDGRVQLGAATLGALELRSLAHDLMVPNVRSVLLWGGESLHDQRYRHLSELVDVVILFSSGRDAGLQPLKELAEVMEMHGAEKIRDLSFLRLLPWQDLIAHFFDDPQSVEELDSLECVEIHCGSPPEAYYFVGWLASRLRWEACGANEFCNPHGRVIRFSFAQEGPVRRIGSITLHSAHSTFDARIDASNDDLVCLTVEGANARPHRCLPLHDLEMVSLIERAIFEPLQGQLFAETFTSVRRLLDHCA